MSDYAKTLRELREDCVGNLRENLDDIAQGRWSRKRAGYGYGGACLRRYARVDIDQIRAIDAALCALRVVKPELGPCTMCMRRCMLDYDFCDTECCEDCAEDGANKLVNE